MISEFKEFIARGNVIDMAVGIIMGGAFTPIVNSLVNDIVMPGIGLIVGKMNFSDLKIVLQHGVPADEAAGIEEVAEVAIAYGNFIQVIINFIIVAFCVFMLIKGINAFRRKEEPAPEPEPEEPEPTAEELLLAEIRDLLKGKNEADGETLSDDNT
ncbi:MAG: large-conductance mechanosensitive channel protein MscL [Oscillospiraceae bacterium]|nr:large-conductance mechanosensitive channel protein MscL [Oscillospiraceae bacterium]